MKTRRILKRTVCLGIFWIIGSIQNIRTADNNLILLLYLCTGALGITQCVCSCDYLKYRGILKIITGIQTVYYLAALGYVLTAADSGRLFACAIAIISLTLSVTAFFTLRNKQDDGRDGS